MAELGMNFFQKNLSLDYVVWCLPMFNKVKSVLKKSGRFCFLCHLYGEMKIFPKSYILFL